MGFNGNPMDNYIEEERNNMKQYGCISVSLNKMIQIQWKFMMFHIHSYVS